MSNPVDPAPVLDPLDGFRRSKAMFAALELHPDATERLLDACVGMDLLAKKDGVYSNLPVATVYLLRTSPQALIGYIEYSNRVGYKLWGDLETAIRKGVHLWETTYGLTGNIFDHFFKTEDSKREFLLGMHGMGMLSSPLVVGAFDLSRFQHLVDLGGATGHLALEACRRYPKLRATVFDLPPVIATAREFLASLPEGARVDLAAGDFFADPLPQADLFTLGRIVHDWSVDKIRTLLKKIHDRLAPGGALLIAERLLNADKSGPLSGQLQSLNMLVCTEGKERNAAEYRTLLEEAGFRDIQARETGSVVDAILAVKA